MALTTAARFAFPALPTPPSWYPGHMAQFQNMLPTLLSRTDIVLELRDARLPLTSINRTFEGALQKWRTERVRLSTQASAVSPTAAARVCERIVVFTKRDLVQEWGVDPFCRAMEAKFPDQRVMFASWNTRTDLVSLNKTLVNIAKRHSHMPELNVLVVGMPNVGKSTLLNALRNVGIQGPTPKAMRTSPQPGLTRALSTRLKLSLDPLLYAFDTPGIMLPFLGRGERGAERGIKLALIAGIKEGLYDIEDLAAYLLYRLNVLNPDSPAYLSILPPGTPPPTSIHELLPILAKRLGMLKREGRLDTSRAGVWFVKWWRDKGKDVYPDSPFPTLGLDDSTLARLESGDLATDQRGSEVGREHGGQRRIGWGFDLEWDFDPAVDPSLSLSTSPPEPIPSHSTPASSSSSHVPETLSELTPEPVPISSPPQSAPQPQLPLSGPLKLRDDQELYVQRKMEECIEAYMLAEKDEHVTESVTQEKKRVREEDMKKRKERSLRRLANKKGGGRGMH